MRTPEEAVLVGMALASTTCGCEGAKADTCTSRDICDYVANHEPLQKSLALLLAELQKPSVLATLRAMRAIRFGIEK